MNNNEKKIRPLQYKPHYLNKPMKVTLLVGAYLDNNSLYIELLSARDCEPYTDLTVNVNGSEALAPYQAAVKNYSENEGIERFIEDNALGTPTGQTIHSGYVVLPVYQFNREKLLEFSVNGVSDYEDRQGKPPEKRDPFEGMDGVRISL